MRGIRLRELITSFLLAINIAGADATSVVVASFFPFLVARIFSSRFSTRASLVFAFVLVFLGCLAASRLKACFLARGYVVPLDLLV